MKFAMSYSCGKDSALALHKMLENGHEAVCLIVTVNKDMQRSWFHGVDISSLNRISDALGIALIVCESTGEEYQSTFENALKKAKQLGAEACVFGDIDIQGHFDWGKELCQKSALLHVFPLWQQSREKLANEVIDLGFHAIIKCVDLKILNKSFLGKRLSKELISEIKLAGADACGENGEYHTIVVNGPIFKKKLNYTVKNIIDFVSHAAIDIVIEN